MAVTKPAGNPKNHQGIGVKSKEDRSDRSYGTANAGFGLTKGGMDDIPTKKREQTKQGKESGKSNYVAAGFSFKK